MKRYWIPTLGILLLAAPVLFLRARAEVSDRSVEIILDEKAFERLRLSAGLATGLFWGAFRGAGATSIGVSEVTLEDLKERYSVLPAPVRKRMQRASRSLLGKNEEALLPEDLGLGFDLESLRPALEEGTLLCLRPQAHPGLSASALPLLFEGIPWDRVSLILFSENRVLGLGPFPESQADTAGFLRDKPVSLGMIEFFSQRGLRELAQALPRRALRVFSVSPEGESIAILLSRIGRAVGERHVRGVYLHPLPGAGSLSLAQNLRWVEAVAERITSRGLVLARAKPIAAPEGFLPILVHQILALTLALITPLFGFFFLLRNAKSHRSAIFLFLAASGITLAGSLGVAALLSRWEFMSAVEGFRAVKPALLLPSLFALLWISRPRLLGILRSPLQVWQFLAAVLILLAAVFLAVRSGNLSASLTLPGEEFFRGILESLFHTRPRSKEFLFGHPLLWLGIFLMKRDRGWGQWLLALGLIGQASIVNTFCHAHAPLAVSLQRVLWGLALGALIGAALERIGVRCSVFGKTLRKPLTAHR